MKQQRQRRDTPAPVHMPVGPLAGAFVAGGEGDELEEKTGVVHLGGLVDIPMENDDDDDGEDGDGQSSSGETDTLHRQNSDPPAVRKSWTPPTPTIVQLPSKRASYDAEDDGTSLRPSPKAAITKEEQIDAEVFNALPPDIQQEILTERAAKLALQMELAESGGAERETRDSSSREASFERYDESEMVSPRIEEDGCWVCRVCTFANHPQLAECEICETLCVQDDDEFATEEEQDELRSASQTSTPSGSNSRSRAGSMGNELYSKLSQKLSSSAMSRSLKKIRLPATPAATKLTMKEDPTAEDLLIVATAQIQKLQSSASQTLQNAKQSIIGHAASSRGRLHSDARLPSHEAVGELGVLQRDLNLKCEAGNELYESLLERLWNAIYQDAPMMAKKQGLPGTSALPKREFTRVSDGWIDIGFQGPNPDTDFRGGGVLALKCLVYVFEAFPQKMLEIVLNQKPSPGKKWYPVCVAGINLTCMIAGLLKLGNGKYEETVEPFWTLFEEPSAFYQLFFYGKWVWARFLFFDAAYNYANLCVVCGWIAFMKMDAVWRRMNASYMEFGGKAVLYGAFCAILQTRIIFILFYLF